MAKVVDLFAGCGGLSQGFKNEGFDLVAAFEYWDVAADCYSENFDHEVYRSDLNDVSGAVEIISRYQPEVIIGGPPCQDFSHAGKRVEAGRASLTESYAKIIEAVKPKMFLMENVDRAQNSNAYFLARKRFKDAGYGLTERVLLASKCGVPQRRKRFFCVGLLGAEDGFLDNLISERIADKEMTVRDYFGDSFDIEYYYRHPRNYNRRGVFSIDEPAPTMRGVNRPVPKGYPGHPNDACPIGPNVRPLTTLERSLIQTFPASYKWTGSKTDREQMIGNAVPVNLAAFVARAMRDYLSELDRISLDTELPGFEKWLRDDKGLAVRSASDAKSRMLRANKILPFDRSANEKLYLAQLDSTESFTELSQSVKSQIRRAVRLFYEYLGKHAV